MAPVCSSKIHAFIKCVPFLTLNPDWNANTIYMIITMCGLQHLSPISKFIIRISRLHICMCVWGGGVGWGGLKTCFTLPWIFPIDKQRLQQCMCLLCVWALPWLHFRHEPHKQKDHLSAHSGHRGGPSRRRRGLTWRLAAPGTTIATIIWRTNYATWPGGKTPGSSSEC